MRLSEMYEDGGGSSAGGTIVTGGLTEITDGQRTRRTMRRKAKKPLDDAIAGVDVDYLASQRESKDKEVTLHEEHVVCGHHI